MPICAQNALILLVGETRDALRMVHNQATNFRNFAAQFVLGNIALALVTLACFGLHVDLAPTAFACLIAIVSSLIILSGTSMENDQT